MTKARGREEEGDRERERERRGRRDAAPMNLFRHHTDSPRYQQAAELEVKRVPRASTRLTLQIILGPLGKQTWACPRRTHPPEIAFASAGGPPVPKRSLLRVLSTGTCASVLIATVSMEMRTQDSPPHQRKE